MHRCFLAGQRYVSWIVLEGVLGNQFPTALRASYNQAKRNLRFDIIAIVYYITGDLTT